MRLLKDFLTQSGNWFRDEKGVSLLEILVSVALLGLIGVAFSISLNIITSRVIQADGASTTEALAKSEMEYIKAEAYTDAPWSYQLPGAPPGWDAAHALPEGLSDYLLNASASTITGLDNDIQKITITVTRGSPDDPWKHASYTLSGYKVNR